MVASRTLPPSSFAALAVPVLAGIGWMAVNGGTPGWIAVNAVALAIALAFAVWLPLELTANRSLVLAVAVVAALWATALTGIEVDGVRRWIGIGPVQLHLGYLVLPLLVVLANGLASRLAAVLFVAALGATLVQPDRAATVALTAAAAALAFQRRDQPTGLTLALGIAACLVSTAQTDGLLPVRFVEHVQSEAWKAMPLAGLALTLATLAPLLVLHGADPAARPLAAFMIAAGLMAFAGHYPAVLIGYGAAPILGFGLALGALRNPNGLR